MTKDQAPGAYRPVTDRWGNFSTHALPERNCLVVADRRVLRLHPHVHRALRGRAVVALEAGEKAKTLGALKKVLDAGVSLSRSGTLLAIGGGTIGDLATVAAHLLKRGVRLLHVPTTLLAAVDSSVGGKGAVHSSAGAHAVKNAAGVFHYPAESWICPEVFTTLSKRQLREGALEAWKMAVCLDAGAWSRYLEQPVDLERLIRDARALKAKVCAQDPYELHGPRAVLNFGHTFGHVIESLTRFRVRHGEAVGLGMLCALDIGRAAGTTPEKVAAEVERGLLDRAGCPDRAALARALAGARPEAIQRLLQADKKTDGEGRVRMVLLQRVGRTALQPIDERLWRPAVRAWARGAQRP